MLKARTFILILVALFVVDIAFGQGCSQCRLMAEQGTEYADDSKFSNGNSAILYLMAMPYFIVMTVVIIVYRKQISLKLKALMSKKVNA